MAKTYQMTKWEWQAKGYQSAMNDIHAIIASTYGDDSDRTARIEEWVKNNSQPGTAAAAERSARVQEFLS